MARANKPNALDLITNLLSEVDMVKNATNLDLASDASSSHPSANVDDGTQTAVEGARSAENKADVKKEVPANVEEDSSKNVAGGSKNQADSMGTQSMASDEGLKGNVDTPKKDHSKSMADSGPGDDTFTSNWDKASEADFVNGANSLISRLSETLGVKTAASKAKTAPAAKTESAKDKKPMPAAPKAEEPPKDPAKEPPADAAKAASADAAVLYKQAAEKYPEDEEAGYVAASMLIDFLGQEKTASEKYGQAVENIVKQASSDADIYTSFRAGFQKAAEMPPGAGGEEAALAALAGGGAGGEMGGMGAMGGMGGPGEMPPMPAGGGGGADLGAALGGLGGGEGGEASDDEAVIEAIAEALDEAGISPEELAEAVAGAGGGEGGEGGGEAPAEAPVEAPAEAPKEEAPKEEAPKEAAAAKPAVKAAPAKGATKKASQKSALVAAVRKLVK